MPQLTPASDYEIKLASLNPISGFPGPFVNITSNTIGQCRQETTGEDAAQGKFSWTAQEGNASQETVCPYGHIQGEARQYKATRVCQCDVPNVCKNPLWQIPENRLCKFKMFNISKITLSLSRILQNLMKENISEHDASKELDRITSIDDHKFKKDDVILTTLILEYIVDATGQLKKTGPNIVKAINNLLRTATDEISASHRESNTSARIITVLNKYLENVPLSPGENISQNEPNLAVFTQVYNATDFNGVTAASVMGNPVNQLAIYDSTSDVKPNITNVSLTIKSSLFRGLTLSQRILFAIYRNTSLFTSTVKKQPDPGIKTVRGKNSFVISGSVKDQMFTNLKDAVETTYRPIKPAIQKSTDCVFWNFTGDGDSGDWSRVGCNYQGFKDGVVTCHCTHLTNFAILMDVYIDDRDDTHDKVLSIVSYIGCAISLLGLILTIVTILIFKDLRSKAPSKILLNFCIALSLTLIVFIAGLERSNTSSLAGCRVAAIALHYFVLAMFVWTSLQAYNMYLAFVKIMPTYHAKFMLKCCVVGWGVPAVIVTITAAVAIEEYGDENFCRVRGLPFQIGFLAPAVLILIVNSIAFVLIIRSLLKAGGKVAADKRATGLQQARRASTVLVVLGLTWLFGVLAIADAKLVFQYLFCIFNSIQGFLVFIFYCVLSSETRAKYKKLCGGGGAESDTTGKKQRYTTNESAERLQDVTSNKLAGSDIKMTNADRASLLPINSSGDG